MIYRTCLECHRLCEKLTRGRCRECRARQDKASFYQSREWRGLRARLIGDRCDLCEDTYRLTLHHTQKRTEGGADSLENLRWTLCGNCHSKLHGGDEDTRRLVDSL